MENLSFDPLVGILISQVFVIWGLVISHFSEKKWAKWITLSAIIPITIFAIFVTYSSVKEDTNDKSYKKLLMERIQLKANEAEGRLDGLNKDLAELSSFFSEVENQIYCSREQTQEMLNKVRTDTQKVFRKIVKLEQLNENLKKSADITQQNSEIQLQQSVIDQKAKAKRHKKLMEQQRAEAQQRELQEMMRHQQKMMMQQMPSFP